MREQAFVEPFDVAVERRDHLGQRIRLRGVAEVRRARRDALQTFYLAQRAGNVA